MSAAKLSAELTRQREIERRNSAKSKSAATPPRSRFAYAAHATKARNRANRIERELHELRSYAVAYACSECGHLHYFGPALAYGPCPVDACPCEHA